MNYHRTRGLVADIRRLLEVETFVQALEALGDFIGSNPNVPAYDRRTVEGKTLHAALIEHQRACHRLADAVKAVK